MGGVRCHLTNQKVADGKEPWPCNHCIAKRLGSTVFSLTAGHVGFSTMKGIGRKIAKVKHGLRERTFFGENSYRMRQCVL